MQKARIFGFLSQCNLFPTENQTPEPYKTVMKIAYYMPFKPMGHSNPSGDLVTGTEIYNDLKQRGHSISLASKTRCRWVYYKPLTLLQLLRERGRILKSNSDNRPDIWLSYHSYYKAPDLLGPICSRKLQIPYAIFQGIYSTKRRKQLKTLPGFLLNRKSLLSADHIFTNKNRDLHNLKRIIPVDKLSYIAPTIQQDNFQFQSQWRKMIRREFKITNETVIMTAAMMRPGVKKVGISTVIESCRRLCLQGHNIRLLIAGDGKCKNQLQTQATQATPLRVHFLGKVPREELNRYYSAADIFAFPGIEESLGMVYLEAQACKLPAVAFIDWGGGEAIIHEKTGLTSPAARAETFTENIAQLIVNKELRLDLGKAASIHVRQHHDQEQNYSKLEATLQGLSDKSRFVKTIK